MIDDYLTDCNVGSRKNQNIHDNLFVVYAAMNSVKKGGEEPLDFADSLWSQSCINDLYKAGLNNDKLKILLSENQNALIALKSAHGVSDRFNVKNQIMQGTIFGGLYCTAQMNILGQISYEDPNIYKLEIWVAMLPNF